MNSTDTLRCENCGRPTSAASLTTSAALPGWVGGPFCVDCARLAGRLAEARPDGDTIFDARP